MSNVVSRAVTPYSSPNRLAFLHRSLAAGCLVTLLASTAPVFAQITRCSVLTGTISTVAGDGEEGGFGDGGPATSAELEGVFGVALDSSGNLYFADANRIRKVTF